MAILMLIDGNYTSPQPTGEPRFEQPFAGVPVDYILKQDFIQYGPNAVPLQAAFGYAPLALNTPYGADFFTANSYPNYFLTAESPLEDLGGGLVKWTRTYCSKPATRYEAASMSYMYPGLNPTVTVTVGGVTSNRAVTIRLPLPKATDVKIQYDYFLIGPTMQGFPIPDYSDFPYIPAIEHQRWGYIASNGAAAIGLVELSPPILWDVPPSIAPLGNASNVSASTYLSRMGVMDNNSASPSYGQYIAPIPPNYFVAEDSVLTRWQGNIFQRATKYIPYL